MLGRVRNSDSERWETLNYFLLWCRVQLPTDVRKATNQSVNSNRLGDRAMDPSDISSPIVEKISRGRD